MKIRCESCGKRYEAGDGICPKCGGYNSTTSYSSHAAPAGTGNEKSGKKSAFPLKKVATFLLGIVLSTWLSYILYNVAVPAEREVERSVSKAVDEATGYDSPYSGMELEELYRLWEKEPDNYEMVYALAEKLYKSGSQSDAQAVSKSLYAFSCGEPAVYRRMGEMMQANGDDNYAVRMFCNAHMLSGLQSDLDLATGCGTPAEIMANGPTNQALEFFFQKPMRKITWEDVGKIRYFSVHSDHIEVSMLDRTYVPDYIFEESIMSFPFESNDTVSFSFLYGLTELHINASIDVKSMNLFGLRQLRALSISNLRDEQDLGIFWDLPGIEELHVAGSKIVTLNGLDYLVNLNSLSLENTAIDNLSTLASYKNIEHLALIKNKSLNNINSLGTTDHLRSLRVENQEIIDFQFLQNYYALEELALIKTEIKDFYFLSQLDTLRRLTIRNNNNLKSVEGIGSLGRLESLTIDCNKMDGIGEISQLSNLKDLRLHTPGTLSMISGLEKLETLYISGAGMLSSIQPVAGLPNLKSVTIASTTASSYDFSLAPLAQVPQLTHLYLREGSFYGSSAAIFSIPTLETLDISGSTIEVSSNGFAGLTGIKALRMSKLKPVTNIRIWSDGFFTSIDYDKMDVTRLVSTLSGLQNLEVLEIADSGLEDISFVKGLPALQSADFSGNYVTDLEPLGDVESLGWVDMSGNPVRDWTVAEQFPAVHVVRR